MRRLEEPAYREIIETGQLQGKASVRRQMFSHMRMANSAGVQATIHLSKHYLGQTERQPLSDGDTLNVTVKGGLPEQPKGDDEATPAAT